ncbi:hypothetical protein VDG1235_3340 [Verrucomicrobiia bacterium DG1235]|nr:hypothetical protein VDG1235_3340 [Verrucomicrobiae bacterium DG1235]
MKLLKLVVSLLAFALASQLAHAIILSGNIEHIQPKYATDPDVTPAMEADIAAATFVKLTVPFTESDPDYTVGQNNFDDFNFYGFDEDQNVMTTHDHTPDVGIGLLPMGTTVASHYVFWDPITLSLDPNRAFHICGSVLFDANILAIFTQTDPLFDTDYLANTGVTYLNPELRGLETPPNIAEIDPLNPKQLKVNWNSSSPGDYVRVLTECSRGAKVPDSGTTVLLTSLGLLALAGARRLRP